MKNNATVVNVKLCTYYRLLLRELINNVLSKSFHRTATDAFGLLTQPFAHNLVNRGMSATLGRVAQVGEVLTVHHPHLRVCIQTSAVF